MIKRIKVYMKEKQKIINSGYQEEDKVIKL